MDAPKSRDVLTYAQQLKILRLFLCSKHASSEFRRKQCSAKVHSAPSTDVTEIAPIERPVANQRGTCSTRIASINVKTVGTNLNFVKYLAKSASMLFLQEYMMMLSLLLVVLMTLPRLVLVYMQGDVWNMYCLRRCFQLQVEGAARDQWEAQGCPTQAGSVYVYSVWSMCTCQPMALGRMFGYAA